MWFYCICTTNHILKRWVYKKIMDKLLSELHNWHSSIFPCQCNGAYTDKRWLVKLSSLHFLGDCYLLYSFNWLENPKIARKSRTWYWLKSETASWTTWTNDLIQPLIKNWNNCVYFFSQFHLLIVGEAHGLLFCSSLWFQQTAKLLHCQGSKRCCTTTEE